MTEGQLVGRTMLKGFLIVAASDAVWHYVFGRSWWSSGSAMMGVWLVTTTVLIMGAPKESKMVKWVIDTLFWVKGERSDRS